MPRPSVRAFALAAVAAAALVLTGCSSASNAVELKSDHADNQGQLSITIEKDDSVPTKETEKVGEKTVYVPSAGAKWTLTNKGDKPATGIYAVQIGGGLPDKDLDESKLPGGKANSLDPSTGTTIKPGESVTGYFVVPISDKKMRVDAGIETGGQYTGYFDPKGTPFEKK